MSNAIVPIVLAVITLLGTGVTVYASRKTSDRASAVQMMELGMTKFVANLENSLARCEGRCDELEEEIRELERDLAGKSGRIEDLEAEVITLHRQLGRLP